MHQSVHQMLQCVCAATYIREKQINWFYCKIFGHRNSLESKNTMAIKKLIYKKKKNGETYSTYSKISIVVHRNAIWFMLEFLLPIRFCCRSNEICAISNEWVSSDIRQMHLKWTAEKLRCTEIWFDWKLENYFCVYYFYWRIIWRWNYWMWLMVMLIWLKKDISVRITFTHCLTHER